MTSRRDALRHSAKLAALLGATGLFPQYSAAFNKGAFDAKSVPDALTALGLGAPTETTGSTVQAPDIAENGAVVPIGAVTTLAGVKQILFLVEKNPTVLIATFNLSDSVDANILTRTKMAESSHVYAAAVMNDGKVMFAKKEIKVTAGGCGG